MATQQEVATGSKIVPHLWFDHQAEEAAQFYASVFPDSHVGDVTPLPAASPSGPEGSVQIVEFTVFNQPFVAINAGPLFRFNPSISFMVNFDPLFFGDEATREQAARKKIDEVWEKLAEGGRVLMPIDAYPFARRYGWVEDRYGLSWQLILSDAEGEPRPAIVPALLFTEQNCGKAEEAVNFYVSVFRDARIGGVYHYGEGQEPDRAGDVMFADFMLENQWFAAMDSAREHGYGFTEAVSLMVNCDDQAEIDYYWNKLSAVPQAEQCGWLADRYGVSWQITPRALNEMLKAPDRERARRATEAMLEMKKFDLAALERAFRSD